MKITKLQIENFRSYENYIFEFDPHKPITLFIGANGQGKTNLLEAIYLLSIGRSFRTSQSEDLIKWEQDFARIRGQFEASAEEFELEFFTSVRPITQKNFRKNEVNMRHSNYLGNFLTVLFHPEDLNMLYLSPSLRRRYLDIVLSQSDRHYLLALSKYKKVVSQRNALLRQIREIQIRGLAPLALLEDLDVWDTELLLYGSQVTEKRLTFVHFLSEHLSSFYNSIADTTSEVGIEYFSKILPATPSALPADPLSLPDIQIFYSEILASRRPLDIIRAETTIGPHRDDLIFSLDGHNVLSSASRGEFRTLLLAIKLAEISFIKSITGQYPVLLLDDVFSELDLDRQKHLLKAISHCQVIITATDIESVALPEEKTRVVTLEDK